MEKQTQGNLIKDINTKGILYLLKEINELRDWKNKRLEEENRLVLLNLLAIPVGWILGQVTFNLFFK